MKTRVYFAQGLDTHVHRISTFWNIYLFPIQKLLQIANYRNYCPRQVANFYVRSQTSTFPQNEHNQLHQHTVLPAALTIVSADLAGRATHCYLTVLGI